MRLMLLSGMEVRDGKRHLGHVEGFFGSYQYMRVAGLWITHKGLIKRRRFFLPWHGLRRADGLLVADAPPASPPQIPATPLLDVPLRDPLPFRVTDLWVNGDGRILAVEGSRGWIWDLLHRRTQIDATSLSWDGSGLHGREDLYALSSLQ